MTLFFSAVLNCFGLQLHITSYARENNAINIKTLFIVRLCTYGQMGVIWLNNLATGNYPNLKELYTMQPCSTTISSSAWCFCTSCAIEDISQSTPMYFKTTPQKNSTSNPPHSLAGMFFSCCTVFLHRTPHTTPTSLGLLPRDRFHQPCMDTSLPCYTCKNSV